MENGCDIPPSGLREAVRFNTERGSSGIEFRRGQLVKLEVKARRLIQWLNQMREGLNVEGYETRASVHVPLLGPLFGDRKMGGGDWRDQFSAGLPTIGDPAEPGVYPRISEVSEPIWR